MQHNGQHLLILTQHWLHTAENSSIFLVSLSWCFSDVSVLSKHSLKSFTIIAVVALGHRCIRDGECFNCRVSAAEEDIYIKANRDKINGSPSLDLNNFSTASPLHNLSHKTVSLPLPSISSLAATLLSLFFHIPLSCVHLGNTDQGLAIRTNNESKSLWESFRPLDGAVPCRNST